MGGRIWSAAEERAFWTKIVPKASEGRQKPSERSFAPLVTTMQIIGDPFRRHYTAQGLYEHWHLNAVQQTFSPNGKAWALKYIRDHAKKQLDKIDNNEDEVEDEENGEGLAATTTKGASAQNTVDQNIFAGRLDPAAPVKGSSKTTRYDTKPDLDVIFVATRTLLDRSPRDKEQVVAKKEKSILGGRETDKSQQQTQSFPPIVPTTQTSAKPAVNGSTGPKSAVHVDPAQVGGNHRASPTRETSKPKHKRQKPTPGAKVKCYNPTPESMHKDHGDRSVRPVQLPPVQQLFSAAAGFPPVPMQQHGLLGSPSDLQKQIQMIDAELEQLKHRMVDLTLRRHGVLVALGSRNRAAGANQETQTQSNLNDQFGIQSHNPRGVANQETRTNPNSSDVRIGFQDPGRVWQQQHPQGALYGGQNGSQGQSHSAPRSNEGHGPPQFPWTR